MTTSAERCATQSIPGLPMQQALLMPGYDSTHKRTPAILACNGAAVQASVGEGRAFFRTRLSRRATASPASLSTHEATIRIMLAAEPPASVAPLLQVAPSTCRRVQAEPDFGLRGARIAYCHTNVLLVQSKPFSMRPGGN